MSLSTLASDPAATAGRWLMIVGCFCVNYLATAVFRVCIFFIHVKTYYRCYSILGRFSFQIIEILLWFSGTSVDSSGKLKCCLTLMIVGCFCVNYLTTAVFRVCIFFIHVKTYYRCYSILGRFSFQIIEILLWFSGTSVDSSGKLKCCLTRFLVCPENR